MKLKYSFDAVDMGEETIAVPVGDGADQMHGVVKLNKSGCEIMDLLKEEITIDDIVNNLAAKYDNSKEELKKYVLHVVEELRKAGILE
jgi:hypothetical protein